MSAANDETYKNLLHEIIDGLVERTYDPKLYSESEFDKGYRFALHYVLSLIKSDVEGFLLEPKDVGFGTFSVDDWFRLGAEYRKWAP